MLVFFLNELSSSGDELSHCRARELAFKLIQLLRHIRKKQKQIALNSAEPINHTRIDPTHTFQELLGGDEFKDEWRFLRSFENRSPIDSSIQAHTLESKYETEYLWQDIRTIALGWAKSLDTAMISFASLNEWEKPEITATLQELDDEAEIIESEIIVRNFATLENIDHHCKWLIEYENYICPSADELWVKREEHFPNLRLLDRTKNDIKRLSSSNTAYLQMYKKLKKLDSDTHSWIYNNKKEIQYSSKTTPEGETRKNFCNLNDIDGEEYCFHMHQRFTGNIAGRIHFRVSTKEKKVVIAYIGKKLTEAIVP